MEAWRSGTYRDWPTELKGDPFSASQLDGKAMRDHSRLYYYLVVLGSLAGELTEDEMKTAMDSQLKRCADAPRCPIFRGFTSFARRTDLLTPSFLAKALTDCCRTARGKDFGRLAPSTRSPSRTGSSTPSCTTGSR